VTSTSSVGELQTVPAGQKVGCDCGCALIVLSDLAVKPMCHGRLMSVRHRVRCGDLLPAEMRAMKVGRRYEVPQAHSAWLCIAPGPELPTVDGRPLVQCPTATA
jgi:hypothetical protein